MDPERSKGRNWNWIIVIVVPALSVALTAQSLTDLNLPPKAVVIERAPIPQRIDRDRELVLWMPSPQRHDRREFSESDPYTCPEWTLGSYYSGPTRISLMNTSAKRVINTVILRHARWPEHSFDIPYRIIGGYYYLVPGYKRGSEGRPALLALRDFNGDGLSLETAFFEAEACMGLPTTLIGYSPKQDRVIQYEVELKITKQKIIEGRGIVDPGESRTETANWVDYLFSTKPSPQGHWSYQIDYTGRAGNVESYDVTYDPSSEKFIGSCTTMAPSSDVQ
jgi:hypothetical protein